MYEAVVLSALMAIQSLAGNCEPPTQGVYRYRPIYEEYGGMRIAVDEDPPIVSFGHLAFAIEICNARSAFVCAYGTGIWFAVPRDPKRWVQGWTYKSSSYSVVETFNRKIDGREVNFVVFDLASVEDQQDGSYPTKRFVYSQEYGLRAVMMVRDPQQTLPGDPVKSPLLFDIYEAEGPGFGRVCNSM